MKKNKILHLITSLKTGGAETVLVDLLRNINKDLFDNEVFYFHEGPNVERIQKLGIKTHQIKGLICKYDPVFIVRLFLLIKKVKPDIIHSLLWSANILGTTFAYLLNIPIVCALHLATNFEAKGKNNSFRNLLDRLVLPKAKGVIAVSESLVKELDNTFPIEKITVIKNGIDINEINLNITRHQYTKQDYGINNDTFVIGSVGRFVPRKNHVMLIDGFAKLTNSCDAHLVMVGYGPLEGFLRSKVMQLGLDNKVTFLKTNNACQVYPIFDCFALTSENEGLPLVVMEAMLFGLPCIVTNKDYEHELITTGINGYVIKNNDTHDLVNKLNKIYTEKEERLRIGLNAKDNISKNFNVHKMVKQYESTFNKTLLKNSVLV